MRLSANGSIALVFIASLVLIGYLFAATPETAATQLPLIFAGVGGVITLLIKQGETDARVDRSVATSQINTEKLDQVHAIVNSQRTAMEEKIAELQFAIAALREERAAASAISVDASVREQRSSAEEDAM